MTTQTWCEFVCSWVKKKTWVRVYSHANILTRTWLTRWYLRDNDCFVNYLSLVRWHLVIPIHANCSEDHCDVSDWFVDYHWKKTWVCRYGDRHLVVVVVYIFEARSDYIWKRNGESDREPEVKLWSRLVSHKVGLQPYSQCCAHSHVTRTNSKFSSHSPQNKPVHVHRSCMNFEPSSQFQTLTSWRSLPLFLNCFTLSMRCYMLFFLNRPLTYPFPVLNIVGGRAF